MGRRVLTLFLALTGAAAALPRGAVGERPWYRREYRARRSVVLPEGVKPGDPVILRFGTAGLTRPDGRDVRLVVEHRQAVPHEVLEVGPGDTILVRSRVYDPDYRLHVYFGRSSPPAQKRLSERFPRGLLLEVWQLPEGGCESWEEAAKLLDAAGETIGVLTPRSIFLGLPPLGRSRRYLARYSGRLQVRSTGEHRFETVSDGASFLRIDGELVASWPGFHGLRGYGDPAEREKHSGRIVLKEGTHSIEYVVATRRGGVHLAAWSEPEDERTRPIPARRFIQWREARAGVLESREGTPTADFRWRMASDTNSDAERHDFAELSFEMSGDTGGRQVASVRWDFGDGQRAEGRSVDHVYLKHGLYDVRMEMSFASGDLLEANRKVQVRFESLERRNLDKLLEAYYGKTRSFDRMTLPPGHLSGLIWLLGKDHRWESDLWKAVEAWYERALAPAPEDIADLGLRRASLLVREGSGEFRARRILEAVADAAPKKRRRVEAQAWLAWISARDAGSPDSAAAVATLRRLYEEGGVDDGTRRAGIFLARALLARGRAGESEKILERLETDPGFRRYEGHRQLVAGVRRTSLDNLLRTEKLREAGDEIERWEWELPADMLSGALQLARARYYRALGRLDEALEELSAVEKIPRARSMLPRALLLRAEIFESQKKNAEARRCLRRLTEEFPERPESRTAAERLGRREER